jgi:hypothetical protein
MLLAAKVEPEGVVPEVLVLLVLFPAGVVPGVVPPAVWRAKAVKWLARIP